VKLLSSRLLDAMAKYEEAAGHKPACISLHPDQAHELRMEWNQSERTARRVYRTPSDRMKLDGVPIHEYPDCPRGQILLLDHVPE
jgi:hypothetical protein